MRPALGRASGIRINRICGSQLFDFVRYCSSKAENHDRGSVFAIHRTVLGGRGDLVGGTQ